jgi:hypothetical protein
VILCHAQRLAVYNRLPHCISHCSRNCPLCQPWVKKVPRIISRPISRLLPRDDQPHTQPPIAKKHCIHHLTHPTRVKPSLLTKPSRLLLRNCAIELRTPPFDCNGRRSSALIAMHVLLSTSQHKPQGIRTSTSRYTTQSYSRIPNTSSKSKDSARMHNSQDGAKMHGDKEYCLHWMYQVQTCMGTRHTACTGCTC